VDALELGEWVHFSGMVPPNEALAYLEVADVLVSPRLAGTSIPLKIYSYLRAGKAIVATNIPSHTQILNEDSALIVEPTSPGLAGGLLSALGSSELRKRLGGQASQQAQRFNKSDDYVVRLGRLYKEIQMSEPRTGNILKNLEA
jgi:glycosyltransferase involved in cell wall biosynthesis